MKFTEYIEIGEWNGRCRLSVSDAELHDFLDDVFVEAGFDPSSAFPPDAQTSHSLIFPIGISSMAVYRLLEQIGSAEIERVAQINKAP